MVVVVGNALQYSRVSSEAWSGGWSGVRSGISSGNIVGVSATAGYDDSQQVVAVSVAVAVVVVVAVALGLVLFGTRFTAVASALSTTSGVQTFAPCTPWGVPAILLSTHLRSVGTKLAAWGIAIAGGCRSCCSSSSGCPG